MSNRLKHLAMIMDGNGRWAQDKGKKRIFGHKAGTEIIEDLAIYCAKDEDIKYLTLYAFSTENWNRPRLEIEFLMKLLDFYLQTKLKIYMKNNIKFNIIGDISRLSKSLQRRIQKTMDLTKNGTKLTLTLAVNYGGKDEITRAINKAIDIGEKIDENQFEKLLDTYDMPCVDLLIRTGGNCRISNFMLWQIAYAEFYFTDTLWPDFCVEELTTILDSYKLRHRRFGGL